QLLGQAPRPRRQRRDIGPLDAGEGDAIELLQHVAQLAQARSGPRPLHHAETLVRIERGMRRGHRPRQRGPQPPGRAGGDGPGLAGGEPARIRHLTFQWNWRWLEDVARGPAAGGGPAFRRSSRSGPSGPRGSGAFSVSGSTLTTTTLAAPPALESVRPSGPIRHSGGSASVWLPGVHTASP